MWNRASNSPPPSRETEITPATPGGFPLARERGPPVRRPIGWHAPQARRENLVQPDAFAGRATMAEGNRRGLATVRLVSRHSLATVSPVHVGWARVVVRAESKTLSGQNRSRAPSQLRLRRSSLGSGRHTIGESDRRLWGWLSRLAPHLGDSLRPLNWAWAFPVSTRHPARGGHGDAHERMDAAAGD